MPKLRLFAFADEASPTVDGQIAAMRRNCLDGLEIRTVDKVNVSDLSLAKAREVRKKLNDNGLIVWSLGSPIGKIDIERDDSPAHLEKLRRTLEIAEALGAENIRLFSFYLPQGANPANYTRQVVDRLGDFLRYAQDAGVTLCHENEKGIYGDTAARCDELLRALPALQGVFDPANFIQCHQDTLQAWALLRDRIRYLHIKDALADGAVAPAGQGVGHVREILADFRARGGDAVTIEPHLKVFSGLNALERAGEESNVGSFCYPTNDAAFDAACAALRALV